VGHQRVTGQRAGNSEAFAAAASAQNLLNVVYRSDAVRPLAGTDMQGLVRGAQARNRAEAITGLVLYDDFHFYQWLEGPADSLGRLMQSISADARHTAIRVLANRAVERRTFQDWAMQLAWPDRSDIPEDLHVLHPSPGMIDSLRQHPDDAPDLLAGFAALDRAGVEALVTGQVLPRLLGAFRERLGEREQPVAAACVLELAALLLAGEQDRARTLISHADARGLGATSLFGSLIEPAARHMGDLWSDDLCSSFDITLALCGLRAAVHQACILSSHATIGAALPKVMIAACPAEFHTMASVLDGEVLWHRGWLPRIEFPQDEAEFCRLLAAERFDCLILGLSAVDAHAQSAAMVRRTIAAVRAASSNPALGIVVSGRAAEDDRFASSVGADAGSASASRIVSAIRRSRPAA
jgi:methanogenic corrinoid protein MtbC1